MYLTCFNPLKFVLWPGFSRAKNYVLIGFSVAYYPNKCAFSVQKPERVGKYSRSLLSGTSPYLEGDRRYFVTPYCEQGMM